ncbi:MAG: DnaB-like helicase N-terminal domain-containing protein [Chthoniobacterales bacterium]
MSQPFNSVESLPADEAAEKCILGTLLLGEANVRELAGEIDPCLFFFPGSRIVFEAILSIHAAGEPIDVLVLQQYLIKHRFLDKAGGAEAISQLFTEHGKTPTVARYELSVLRDLYGKRELLNLSNDLKAQCLNGRELAGIAGEVQSRLAKINRITSDEGCLTKRASIEFQTPSQLQGFVPPPGMVLVGDCHIVRGSVFVIGGAPGVGKSRAAVALAVAGATGRDWFGLPVHRKFRVMIVQSENGRFRLSKEFAELDCKTLDEWVCISPPPPFGMSFDRAEFRDALAKAIADFKPDVIILDPWNAVARDDKQRDYLDTFALLRSVIPAGDDAPALGIVAHTRKPKGDERKTGRGLLNDVAGSHVLASVPRSVFVMQAATDDPEDNRIAWTCCKNNDGELGGRSAWERRNGLFAPVSDFEWDAFDSPKDTGRVTISSHHLAEIFAHGKTDLPRAEAAKALQTATGAGRTACYEALKLDGRFSAQLAESKGILSWKA